MSVKIDIENMKLIMQSRVLDFYQKYLELSVRLFVEFCHLLFEGGQDLTSFLSDLLTKRLCGKFSSIEERALASLFITSIESDFKPGCKKFAK